MSKEIRDLFEPSVFKWLDIISKGTNKRVVKELLTPKGISYTFQLSSFDSEQLFKKWKQTIDKTNP